MSDCLLWYHYIHEQITLETKFFKGLKDEFASCPKLTGSDIDWRLDPVVGSGSGYWTDISAVIIGIIS